MTRNNFLHPPSGYILNAWEEPSLPPVRYSKEYEAQCSSWIEGEEDYDTCLKALRRRRTDITTDMLLDTHGVLLKDQNLKAPGLLRPYNVRVGNHIPPDWNEVPSLMVELDAFLSDGSIPPVLKAVWGHIQFETIHPFADGNGRIGRLLVNKILDRPFAPAVATHRSTYYSLLGEGDWDSWRAWMVAILEECPDIPTIKENPFRW